MRVPGGTVAAMQADNDTRGWIMTCVSGVACVGGASIICVDLIIQRFPGRRHFRIQDSNNFLAASLSLSFGVMLYSSLNSMLPSAQKYLSDGGASASVSAWVTIACFLGGIVGIRFLSRIIHRYIPSHVVGCDHTHNEQDLDDNDDDDKHDNHHHSASHQPNGTHTEQTPLLSQSDPGLKPGIGQRSMSSSGELNHHSDTPSLPTASSGRPTPRPGLTNRVTTFMRGAKSSCDEGGPCYGYSNPCGDECVKVADRSPTRNFGRFSKAGVVTQPSLLRNPTAPRIRPRPTQSQTYDPESLAVSQASPFTQRPPNTQRGLSSTAIFRGRSGSRDRAASQLHHEQSSHNRQRASSLGSISESDTANDASHHHHHVPRNAFLSMGVQTSIAIALHKLPEGFITYATNHANPSLGLSVFLALFIHNITEGFALALPLYLAINSRWQAMMWSSILGGASQPLGAGIAAAWFKIAGNGSMQPGDTVYGCMFSITAGIMASVALELFSQSLTLTHNRQICAAFAFIGMAILGASHALTA